MTITENLDELNINVARSETSGSLRNVEESGDKDVHKGTMDELVKNIKKLTVMENIKGTMDEMDKWILRSMDESVSKDVHNGTVEEIIRNIKELSVNKYFEEVNVAENEENGICTKKDNE